MSMLSPAPNMAVHNSKLELSGDMWLHLPRLVSLLQSPLAIVLIASAAYTSICRALRFRRVRELERKYGDRLARKDDQVIKGRPDVKLTPQEMQGIIFTSLEYDMPSLMHYSLIFGLFKTYGIVSISPI